MTHQLVGTLYFHPRDITKLICASWMDPTQYLVEIRNYHAPACGHVVFVSTRALAKLLFPAPVCPVCTDKGYVWLCGKGDDMEKELCPRCTPVCEQEVKRWGVA